MRTRLALIISMLTAALVVPVSGAHAYTIASGDTLSTIASRHGVSTRALADANGIEDADRIVSGTTLVIPGADGTASTSTSSHVIRPGETLSQIAARYGVSTRALAEANGITDPNQIRAGQSLAVAGGSTPPAASASAAPSGSATAASSGTVRSLITAAAQSHGWRPAVPLGLAMQESGWNNTVVSSAGARGIMQVMPATGEWVGTYLLRRPLDLGDPADNVAAGMAYLDYLYGRFDGDLERTLAAYYEGPGRVDRNGVSTGGARYAANVLALADRYR